MRVWLAVLSALGVLVGGCARQRAVSAAPATPGPKTPPASIVSVDPSPTSSALVIGVTSAGPPPGLDHMPGSPGALWLIDLRTGATSNLSPEVKQGPRDPHTLGWSSLSWRADGGAVAVGTPEGRIVIHDVPGGGSRVVSPEGLWCLTPAWSPDGKRLAFAALDAPPGPGWSPGAGRNEASLYVMPADGSAPPRLQVAGLALSTRWWWSADGRRLRYVADGHGTAERADAKSIAEPISSEEVRHADAVAWSPDHTRLAYSSEGDRGRGSVTTVVDASLAPLMTWQDPDIPARGLRWSLDGKQLLIRNDSGNTYLLDLARRTGALVDDPVAAGKEPAGWIRWSGKQQLVFIDEEWKRLVVMEDLKGPAYTLITLGEGGAPSLVLPATKGK